MYTSTVRLENLGSFDPRSHVEVDQFEPQMKYLLPMSRCSFKPLLCRAFNVP